MTAPLPEWFATDIDLRHNQLLNARAETKATPPVSPIKGQLWFDDSITPGVLKYFDGSQWTGGRTFYNTVLDDGVVKPQHNKLNFRSTSSVDTTVIDEGSSDTSSVTMAAKYGPVKASVLAGEAASSGSALTLARSDHSHGSPSSAGADTVLISWWQYDQQLWSQLLAAATFIADLPGDVVGGGWLLTDPGTVYWTGNPTPVSRSGVYRNSVRISALNGPAAVTVGWRCFGAAQQLLGQVKCINAVPIEQGTEAGVLVARNHVTNPSGEGPGFGGDDGWHSNPFFGTGAIASVTQSTDRASTGTHSVKTVWPGLAPGTIASYCVIRVNDLTPGAVMTLSARIFVPTGSPDVNLDCVFFGTSPVIRLKNQWVDATVTFTVPANTDGHVYVGLYCPSPTAGGIAYLDNVMVREGTTPLPDGRTYFDGNTASSEIAIFAWDGEADNSSSSFYTLEPSWEIVDGYIGVGDGVEPGPGQVADVEEAVNPPEGTVYFQPFVASEGGSLLLDTHEVARNQRDLVVIDGLSTGWVDAENTVTADEVSTNAVSPPDTEPPSYLQVGPLVDPPLGEGDAIPRAYLERVLGSPGADITGELPPLPPQFMFSGATADNPAPADVGFGFAAWPLWSLWLDTSVQQARPMMIAGTSQGTVNIACPLVSGTFAQVPGSYGVVLTPPVDGMLLGVSSGSAYAEYADYLEMRCSIYEGADDSGNGGTAVGYSGAQVFSASSGAATNNRAGYTLFNAYAAKADTRYKVATTYTHGGSTATTNRDRTFVLFLPGVKVAP